MEEARMKRYVIAATTIAAGLAQTVSQPVRSVTDPGVVTTRQAITPAGVPSVFQGRVYGVAWAGKGGDLWVLHATQLYRLDWKNNRVVSHAALDGAPGNGAIVADPATGEAVIGQSMRDPKGGATLAGVAVSQGDGLKPVARSLGRHLPGVISVAAEADANGRRYAAVP